MKNIQPDAGLAHLEAQIRTDLVKTAHPDAAWLQPLQGPDRKPAQVAIAERVAAVEPLPLVPASRTEDLARRT